MLSQELQFGRRQEAEKPKRVEEFVKALLDPPPAPTLYLTNSCS